ATGWRVARRQAGAGPNELTAGKLSGIRRRCLGGTAAVKPIAPGGAAEGLGSLCGPGLCTVRDIRLGRGGRPDLVSTAIRGERLEILATHGPGCGIDGRYDFHVSCRRRPVD